MDVIIFSIAAEHWCFVITSNSLLFREVKLWSLLLIEKQPKVEILTEKKKQKTVQILTVKLVVSEIKRSTDVSPKISESAEIGN